MLQVCSFHKITIPVLFLLCLKDVVDDSEEEDVVHQSKRRRLAAIVSDDEEEEVEITHLPAGAHPGGDNPIHDTG